MKHLSVKNVSIIRLHSLEIAYLLINVVYNLLCHHRIIASSILNTIPIRDVLV